MDTIIGIIIGIAATILVARYYFWRSINKRLSVFVTLSNRVFSGIDDQVRKRLAFRFGEKEIDELQQLDLIIANDGDRAIRDFIEPLKLKFKKRTEILDASIIHRNPDELQASIEQEEEDGKPIIICNFPLLNSGEFFMLKLLLDGYVSRDDLECMVLVDDLPRSFSARLLPRTAVTEPKRTIDWAGLTMGAVILVGVASVSFLLWSYYTMKPSIWPLPWLDFRPSWIETPALIISALGTLFMALMGLVAFIGIGFEGFFSRHPTFPLPEGLRGQSYRFPRRLALDEALDDELPDFDQRIEKTPESEQGSGGNG